MSATPPLGESNDTQRTCSRFLGMEDGREVLCGKRAVEHLIYWWDPAPTGGEPGFDHGFCCIDHWTEFQGRWTCAGHHGVNEVCGMPGSRVHPERPCFFDELPTVEPQRAKAVAS